MLLLLSPPHSLSPASHGIVSGGAVELVYHWMDKGNADLESFLAESTNEYDSERLVILKGLRYRLAYSKPVVWTWPQAMALGAEPSNMADTLARLSQISDIVCRFAEEANATGSAPAGLSKHPAAVGAAYAAAELYMLTDYSENFEDTWAFLERRVNGKCNYFAMFM
jgi:ubiquinone biosynthesis protein COQ9